MSYLYETNLVLTFPASDIYEADNQIDLVIEELESKGYQLEAAIVEESVEIRDE